MTPPSMDVEAATAKLALLADLLDDLCRQGQPTGYRDSFEVVARAGVVPAELAERLAPSAGMRNILTYEYGRIDLDQVAAAVPRARRDYGDYVRQVGDHLLHLDDT